jgi:hypothetical protein
MIHLPSSAAKAIFGLWFIRQENPPAARHPGGFYCRINHNPKIALAADEGR